MNWSRIFARTIAYASLVILSTPSNAQEELKIDAYCQYAGEALPEDLFGFESDSQAQAAVKRVVDFTGLTQNFTIKAANVPNAAAVMSGQSRMILYNQAFMFEVAKVDPNWAAISIMAHEVGHHLNAHTITDGGSRPSIELEADRYSGYVLQRMGATLVQAQAAMNQIGSEAGSATHPSKSARLAAISNGWFASIQLTTPAPPSSPVSEPQPQAPSAQLPSPGSSPSPALSYTGRVVFLNDPVSYYVTSTNDIVGVPPGGTPTLVGNRIPPTMPGFAWMYQTATITYGVTPQGQVMSRTQFGQVFQVGHVTAP